jgi:hypothetical protein
MTAMQPRSREEAKLLGLPDWQIDQMFPVDGGDPAQVADAAPVQSSPSLDIDSLSRRPPQGLIGSLGVSHNNVPAQAMPQAVQPAPAGLLDDAPEAPKGFWQGGDKFRARDAIGGLLAAIGDGLTQHGGGQGFAVKALIGQRTKGAEALEAAQKEYKRKQQLAALPGMTARELLAFDADPKAWGGHMADAYSTHHAAANVNPGEQRLFGNPNAGGKVYQAPTAAEQYAGSLGKAPRTSGYNTALQDYVLKGSGPTAFGYDAALDDHRTANDVGVEGLRQRNRMGLRSAPTYRDSNPRPVAPRASPPRRKASPTATGPNGEKVMWNGKNWVPAR